MDLNVIDAGPTSVRAGYTCPCGCTPSVEYARGAELAREGCCCGNQFAVGPRAAASLGEASGFRPELQQFAAPWGEPLEAAWLVGPSVHGSSEDQQHGHGHDHDGSNDGRALDPVCGMTVDPASARAKGLHSAYRGADYFFCGKGCKLEFDDDAERYLDPAYQPSM